MKYFIKAKNVLLVTISFYSATSIRALLQEDDFTSIESNDAYPSYTELLDNTKFCFHNCVLIDPNWVLAPANQNFSSILTSEGQKLEIDIWIKHPDYIPNAKWYKPAYNFQLLHLKDSIVTISPVQRMLWNNKVQSNSLDLIFATTQQDSNRQIGSSLSKIKNTEFISKYDYIPLSAKSKFRTPYESMMQQEDAGTGVLFSSDLKPPYQLLGLLSKINPDFKIEDLSSNVDFVSENVIGKTNDIINKAIVSQSIEGVSGLTKAVSNLVLDDNGNANVNISTQMELPASVGLNGALIHPRLVLILDNSANPKVYNKFTIGQETIDVEDINLLDKESGLRLLYLKRESTIDPIKLVSSTRLQKSFVLLPHAMDSVSSGNGSSPLPSAGGPPTPPTGGPPPPTGGPPPPTGGPPPPHGGPPTLGKEKLSTTNKTFSFILETTNNSGIVWINDSITFPEELSFSGINSKAGYPMLLATSDGLKTPQDYELLGFKSSNYRKFDEQSIKWIENVKEQLLSENFDQLLEDLSSNDSNLVQSALISREISRLKELSSATNLVKAIKEANEAIKKTNDTKLKIAEKSLKFDNSFTQNYVFINNNWLLGLAKGPKTKYGEVIIGKEKFAIEDPKTIISFDAGNNNYFRLIPIISHSNKNINPIERNRSSYLEMNENQFWFTDSGRTNLNVDASGGTGKPPELLEAIKNRQKLEDDDSTSTGDGTKRPPGATPAKADAPLISKLPLKIANTLKPAFSYNDQFEVIGGQGTPNFGSGLFAEINSTNPVKLIGFITNKDASVKDKNLYSIVFMPSEINTIIDKLILAEALEGNTLVEKIYNEYSGIIIPTLGKKPTASTTPKRPVNTGARLDYLVAQQPLSHNYSTYQIYKFVNNQFETHDGKEFSKSERTSDVILRKIKDETWGNQFKNFTFFLPTDNALTMLNPIMYTLVNQNNYKGDFLWSHMVKGIIKPEENKDFQTGHDNFTSTNLRFLSTNDKGSYKNLLENGAQKINIINSKIATNGYLYSIDEPIISDKLINKIKNDLADDSTITLRSITSVLALNNVTQADVDNALTNPFKKLSGASTATDTILASLESQTNCSDFLNIVKAAKMEDYFNRDGNYTLLAPTNTTLKKTMKLLKYKDVNDMVTSLSFDDLQYYVKMHFIDKKVTSDLFSTDSANYFAWSNSVIKFQTKGNVLTADIMVTPLSILDKNKVPTVIIPQAEVTNGIIYLLDTQDLVQRAILVDKFKKR